jgi:predicted CopG family antitoxin
MGEQQKKERTTVWIDKDLWKKFKKHAIDEDKSASELLEELVRKKVG